MPRRIDTFVIDGKGRPQPLSPEQSSALSEASIADDAELLAYVSRLPNGDVTVQVLRPHETPNIVDALEEAAGALRNFLKGM